MNGVMIHHIVTSDTENAVKISYDGRPDLPDPLCHGVIGRGGLVCMVGNGRTNHAGRGDGDVLRAVIDERPLPRGNERNTDGNARVYGFVCESLGDGVHPWPEEQLEAIEKAAAAICRTYGWHAGSVTGRLEWQPGKIDPKGFTMDSMRARIAGRLVAT
ncbi:N-acetylmuramoyl-L-alanine amidase [Streptomyces decoyicus]|uniref:N-acetylmuramoyl-L-alanine amidase n=1 Tax=Streptomyces decoyicus TaxID=249567 RepID=UPI0033DFC3BF